MELRNSFLHASVSVALFPPCPIAEHRITSSTHLSMAHSIAAYPAIIGGMKYRTWFRERRTTFQKPLLMKVAIGRCLLGLSE